MPPRRPPSAIAIFAVLAAALTVAIAGGVLALRPSAAAQAGHRSSVAPTSPPRPASSRMPGSRAPESRVPESRPAQSRAAQSRAPASRPTEPEPAPASRPDPFGAVGQTVADAHPGVLLAAVDGLSTGQQWSLGQGRPQAEASVVKLDILETLLARNRNAGSTPPPGDQYAAEQMMEYSDNTAATALWFAAGGPEGIASYNAAAGLRSTSLSQCVDCPGFGWPGWGLSTTTPEDQIALLGQLISPRSLLTAGQRRYALGLMENVTPQQRWGVSGGVPSGVTVALKDGWLPLDAADDDWQVNSVGWVSGDGRDYLMAVLSTGNPTEQAGIDVIDELSAIVWQALK